MVICLYGASSQNIHPDYTAGVEAFGREIGRRGTRCCSAAETRA